MLHADTLNAALAGTRRGRDRPGPLTPTDALFGRYPAALTWGQRVAAASAEAMDAMPLWVGGAGEVRLNPLRADARVDLFMLDTGVAQLGFGGGSGYHLRWQAERQVIVSVVDAGLARRAAGSREQEMTPASATVAVVENSRLLAPAVVSCASLRAPWPRVRAMAETEIGRAIPDMAQAMRALGAEEARRLAEGMHRLGRFLSETAPLCGDARHARRLAALEERVLRMLALASVPLLAAELPAGRADAARAVSRAIDYIEANSAEPLTLSAVAAAAGLSIRTLQQQFQRRFGAGPMRYLRMARLEQARLRLAAGGGLRVTDVALDCGFSHLGEFALAYRERFGEPPSATLRRAGG